MTLLSQRDPRWRDIKINGTNYTLGTDGLKIYPSHVIFMSMFRPFNYLKVFNSIITPISVNMMYGFRVAEFMTKMFFHKVTMLINLFSRYANKFITSFFINCPAFPSPMLRPRWMDNFRLNFARLENSLPKALIGTKSSFFQSTFGNVVRRATILTNDIFTIFNHINTNYQTQ